ncbi:unnamed protein product, partial [Didymodactylos carnosus]
SLTTTEITSNSKRSRIINKESQDDDDDDEEQNDCVVVNTINPEIVLLDDIEEQEILSPTTSNDDGIDSIDDEDEIEQQINDPDYTQITDAESSNESDVEIEDDYSTPLTSQTQSIINLITQDVNDDNTRLSEDSTENNNVQNRAPLPESIIDLVTQSLATTNAYNTNQEDVEEIEVLNDTEYLQHRLRVPPLIIILDEDNNNNNSISVENEEPIEINQQQSRSHEHKQSIDEHVCPICLESLTQLQRQNINLVTTPVCQHVFCDPCSRKLLENVPVARCPLCRLQLNERTKFISYCINIELRVKVYVRVLLSLQAYNDDDDADGDENQNSTDNDNEQTMSTTANFNAINDPTFSIMSKIKLNLTPAVIIQPENTTNFLDIKTKLVTFNPKYEDMYAPVFGPENPHLNQQQRAFKNMLSGHVESTSVSDFLFENQRRTFDSFGYAADPSTETHSTTHLVGDLINADINEGMTVFETTRKRLADKRKKDKNYDSSDVEGFRGPWAPFVDEVKVSRPTEEEQKELDELLSKRKKRARINEQKEEEEDNTNKTILHIKDPYDYQGRSFLHIPQDVGVNLRSDEPPQRCFIPKQCLHTYKGHTKGVQKIHYFPVSAHLFLTCSMDCKIKLWEFYNERRCIRTYMGHSQAVRDINFNNHGTDFLSASYDRFIKLWDTETGQVKSKFTTRKIPYCVSFNPDAHKQHLFVAGMSDKKIVCFDTRSGHVVQEYDRHLGAINTVTFVDRNRRIVSTSDDKSIRVWEWDIPVDFKYLADPTMHSTPAVALSRNGKYLAFQSMDNQIKIMEPGSNFRWKTKKVFKGHMVSGYACGLDFSPDMSYVISGDADGRLIIWDWKTTRLFERIKAHDDVCIDAKWHWHEKSKILTAGWDGVVKLWD